MLFSTIGLSVLPAAQAAEEATANSKVTGTAKKGALILEVEDADLGKFAIGDSLKTTNVSDYVKITDHTGSQFGWDLGVKSTNYEDTKESIVYQMKVGSTSYHDITGEQVDVLMGRSMLATQAFNGTIIPEWGVAPEVGNFESDLTWTLTPRIEDKLVASYRVTEEYDKWNAPDVGWQNNDYGGIAGIKWSAQNGYVDGFEDYYIRQEGRDSMGTMSSAGPFTMFSEDGENHAESNIGRGNILVSDYAKNYQVINQDPENIDPNLQVNAAFKLRDYINTNGITLKTKESRFEFMIEDTTVDKLEKVTVNGKDTPFKVTPGQKDKTNNFTGDLYSIDLGRAGHVSTDVTSHVFDVDLTKAFEPFAETGYRGGTDIMQATDDWIYPDMTNGTTGYYVKGKMNDIDEEIVLTFKSGRTEKVSLEHTFTSPVYTQGRITQQPR